MIAAIYARKSTEQSGVADGHEGLLETESELFADGGRR